MLFTAHAHAHTQPTQRQLIKGLIDKVAASLRIREDVLGMWCISLSLPERDTRYSSCRHKTSIAKLPEARKLDDRIKQVLNCCSWQQTDKEGDEEAEEDESSLLSSSV